MLVWPRWLATVLTSVPAAIIMVAKVCLRSWKVHLNPFILQKAAKSLPI